MPRGDTWDTPGGPGGKEVLAQVQGPMPGAARALLLHWRQTMADLPDHQIVRYTVKSTVFNTFRRKRLDEGITDEQLAASFEAFAEALVQGRTRARWSDLWGSYAVSWARWVNVVPAPFRKPLTGRTESSRRRR